MPDKLQQETFPALGIFSSVPIFSIDDYHDCSNLSLFFSCDSFYIFISFYMCM